MISAYPLGMEDQTIAREQITASSTQKNWYPYRARLNAPYAWFNRVDDSAPWIQVNFTTSVIIAEIQTQGHMYGIANSLQI